ncbi:hypothetical protein [Enterococcus sp.]|uniref:hypothetical protein n=1 Tax=Enterococcus sp. TaxID=35783 RepID=UPI002FC6B8B0
MKKGTFKMLEGLIEDYPTMDRYIKRVELEIEYPWQESDDNVGGSRSTSATSTTERAGLKLATDKHLRLLRERKKALDKIVQSAKPETIKIIRLWYWTKPRTKTWDGIAEDVGYSKRMCHLLRNEFIECLGKELGEIN